MTDKIDYSTLSEEELDAIIKGTDVTQAPPGKGAEVLATRNAAVAEKQDRLPKSKAEEIEPSAFNRGAAAAGGALAEPLHGLREKFELAFPGASPEAAEATRRRIGEERSERRGNQRDLEETTAGQFGSFVGKAAPFALAGPAAGPQAAVAAGIGFLEGGPDKPTGLGGELTSSGFRGLTDAGATGLTMKGINLAGKGLNAARGKYEPGGREALELDAAARRLGLPPTTIGQLDPLAPEALRANPDTVAAQARALEERLASQRTAPTPGGGTETQTVKGGKLVEGVKEAINVRRQQARQMYEAVDDFAANNNLGNVPASYTVNTLSAANKLTPSGKAPTGNNLVYNLLDDADPDAFAWLKAAGSPQAARQAGMSMTQYHDARVAVGRALGSLERKNPADLTADQLDAKRMLIDLKTALDSDVERWSKANAGNKEAMGLYNNAKEFYAKTVAEATNNPLARKVTSLRRGFNAPEQMYAAMANPANKTLVERLLPTAPRETQDALNVLQNLPDVGRTVATGKVPAGVAEQELGALARASLGHPGLAAMEMAPGLRWLSSKTPAKAVYFGAAPTNRALGPAGQYPAGGLERWARERTSTDQGRR